MAAGRTNSKTALLSLRACPPPAALVVFAPVLVAAFVGTAATYGFDAGSWIAALLGGLVAWTLVEYLSHRFVFHIVPANKALRDCVLHLRHHAMPDDPAYFVVPLWFSLPVVAVVWGLASALVAETAAIVTSGVILGYLAYEWVHWQVHHGRSSWRVVRMYRRHHFHHHFAESDRAFGFTTTAWDRVFGTMPRRGRDNEVDGADR